MFKTFLIQEDYLVAWLVQKFLWFSILADLAQCSGEAPLGKVYFRQGYPV